jgi:hypothetical protein
MPVQLESKLVAAGESPKANGRSARAGVAAHGRLARVAEPMGGVGVVSAALGGLLATALWIAMFTVGLSVPSEPFRNGLLAVAGGEPAAGAFRVQGSLDAMYALAIIAFSYTPTNLAMLCCLAALVGCLAYTATNHYVAPPARQQVLVRIDGPMSSQGAATEGDKPAEARDEAPIPLRPTISAITWGFFIYLFMISGMLLASNNPFAATTPDQYLRLAGTASLVAFVVGWKPELLSRLVAQVGQTRIGSQGESGAKG